MIQTNSLSSISLSEESAPWNVPSFLQHDSRNAHTLDLKFTAPPDGSGPKTIKLFINKLNMGFGYVASPPEHGQPLKSSLPREAEDYPPVQTFTLTPKDLEADSPPLALEFARYVRTFVLTVRIDPMLVLTWHVQIFVEDNQDDAEQTRVSRLVIGGRSVP